MNEITVTELKAKLDLGETPILIDVREEYERETSNIGGIHLPLANLPTAITDLEKYKDQVVVVYCRSGGRSASACGFLLSAGFQHVFNMKGGMKEWKNTIDNTITVA